MGARQPRTPTQQQVIAQGRMNPGSGGGRQAIVAPVASTPSPAKVPTVDSYAEFYQYGAVTLTPSANVPSYTVKAPGLIDVLSASIATAGTSSTVVTFYKNGASIGTVTLVSGDLVESDAITPVRVAVGDRITARVTTAGTGAAGLEAWAPIAA